MTKQEYIDKWRGIYTKKNLRVKLLSKRLCENISESSKKAILSWMNRAEVEAQTINIMLLELEAEVE